MQEEPHDVVSGTNHASVPLSVQISSKRLDALLVPAGGKKTAEMTVSFRLRGRLVVLGHETVSCAHIKA
jgi:hypothetical protein